MDTRCPEAWLCPDFQVNPNSDTGLETLRVCQDTTTATGSSRTSRCPHSEECDRAGQRHEEPRVLLTRISSEEEERHMETGHKSTPVESMPRDSHVHHGICQQDSDHYHTERVGHIIGPNGRLLPCADGTTLQEVPSVRREGKGVSVYSSSLRPIDGTAGIYQDADTSGSPSSLARHQVSSLSRRPSDASGITTSSSNMDRNSHSSVVHVGLPHQHHQVNVTSSSALCIHRSQVPNRPRLDDTTRGSIRQHPREDSRSQRPRSSSSNPLVISTGSTRICRTTSTDGQITHSSDSGLPSQTVQDGGTSIHSTCESRCQCCGSLNMVGRQIECLQRPSSGTIQPPCNTLHRCEPSILGSTRRPRPVYCNRSLVSDRASDVHQPTRTVGSASSIREGTTVLVGQTYTSSVRQLHDSVIHQQDGRYEIGSPDGLNVGPVPTGTTELSSHQSSTHSRQIEQTGRFSIENEPSRGYRMDNGSIHPESSVGPLGKTQHRPDGNQAHESTSSLHITIPRSSSIRSRRNILRLDGDGGVHLSSMAHDYTSTGQATSRELCSDGNHTDLAEPTLVPTTSRTTGRAPSRIAALPRTDYDAPQQLPTRQPAGFTSARLQAIFESATSQGFSREVSSRIATGQHRGSTQNIYCSRWRAFDSWCRARADDPCKASLAQLADFLMHLFRDKRLSPSAIAGYRSAINSVWRVLGRTSTESYHLTQLMKSFKAERPRSLVVLPKWDLALVLSMLTKPPYEPIQRSSFKDLAAKTVFLLLLASSRRRGDIHAIDPRRLTFTKRGAVTTGVVLEPFPGYLPKVGSTAEGQRRYQPIVVKSLNALTADESELALCPVRALQHYDTRARQRLPNRQRFFISSSASASPVSKTTLSAWTVKLIRRAYDMATDDDIRPYHTSTHEVRALAASLALQANFSLVNVLSAATWANPTTFTEYYLRDVSGLQGRLHVIAPCIVAGTTLH